MKQNTGSIDYSQYSNWEKITTPSGGVYYAVPGTGYVYDPFLSQQKRKPVLFINPKAQLEEAEAAKDANSPLKQVAAVAGPVAGQVAGQTAVNALKPATAQALTPQGVLMSDGTLKPLETAGTTAQTAAQAGATAAGQASLASGATTPGQAFASGLPYTAAEVPVATSVTGGADLMAQVPVTTGAESAAAATPGIGVAPYLSAGGAAAGAYGVYDAIESNSPTQAMLSGAGMGLGLAGMAPLVGLGPLGWGAMGLMALGGAGLGGGLQQALGSKSTKEIEADRWGASGAPGEVAQQMTGADYFAGTGGEQSREESFLTPDAIRNNPDNWNNIPDWSNWSKGAQDRFLSTMLSEGKVQEKKGGIYYDDARAKELAKQIREEATQDKNKDMGKRLAARADRRLKK